jgi:ATP-dependent HslUV protease subunit HslV
MPEDTKDIERESDLRICGSDIGCVHLNGDVRGQLEQYRGNVQRAAVELAKEWRKDKYLRRLEAMLAVVTSDTALVVSGNGDVIETEDKIVAIGSGGMYALSAAKMLKKYSNLEAAEIVRESLKTASEVCIYTNDKINVETID